MMVRPSVKCHAVSNIYIVCIWFGLLMYSFVDVTGGLTDIWQRPFITLLLIQ